MHRSPWGSFIAGVVSSYHHVIPHFVRIPKSQTKCFTSFLISFKVGRIFVIGFGIPMFLRGKLMFPHVHFSLIINAHFSSKKKKRYLSPLFKKYFKYFQCILFLKPSIISYISLLKNNIYQIHVND